MCRAEKKPKFAPPARAPKTAGRITQLYDQVAFWQTMIVLALVALVWAKEVLDFPHLFFDAPPSELDWLGAMALTIGVLVCGLIVVAHTYVQQKRIISGFISVCSYCRKVHVEEATWQQMEEYLENRTLAEFTHGVCPTCYEKVMQEIEDHTPTPPETGSS